jgi:hypothetical protein
VDLETTTCRDCKRSTIIGDHQTCGACSQTRYRGDRIHCFTHCLEFIEAQPEERLKMVQTHGDCTTCLERGHEAEAHKEMSKNETPTCGLYIKTSARTCGSIQNAVFHDAASHNTQRSSTYAQRIITPLLAIIIALGILLQGIQASEAAEWHPIRYCRTTGWPVEASCIGIGITRTQVRDRKKQQELLGPIPPTTMKEEGLSGATGSSETPPKWIMSNQKAGHKEAAPKTERFRNCQGEMFDCLKSPIDKLRIKLGPFKNTREK